MGKICTNSLVMSCGTTRNYALGNIKYPKKNSRPGLCFTMLYPYLAHKYITWLPIILDDPHPFLSLFDMSLNNAEI